MLVWAMAQCQKGADHDERDRRVECHGTVFLREEQCKKHHTEAEEDGCKSRLAPEPASPHGLSISGAAFDRRICIFGHVGIDGLGREAPFRRSRRSGRPRQ